jgi:hypothetical protein
VILLTFFVLFCVFQHVVLSDAGNFVCQAENIFNVTSAEGVLLVRRKTLIEQAPMDLEVVAGYDAKFTCSGTTDPEEVRARDFTR